MPGERAAASMGESRWCSSSGRQLFLAVAWQQHAAVQRQQSAVVSSSLVSMQACLLSLQRLLGPSFSCCTFFLFFSVRLRQIHLATFIKINNPLFYILTLFKVFQTLKLSSSGRLQRGRPRRHLQIGSISKLRN